MSMRDSINEALDAVAEEDETQNYDETEQEVITSAAEETSETQAADVTGDDTGASDDTKPDDLALESEEKSGDSIKAPIDWGPEEREQWSKIPRNLQEKVMSREKELNTLMQTTVDARKTHGDFEQLSNKYGSVLSGVIGDTPMEAVGNLFNTVANLRMGSTIQKAQIIADLITDFGVDVSTLDSAIVGAAPPAGQQQNADIEAIVAQRMAPFEAQMGQQKALETQQETQRQDAAMSEVQEFAKDAEFLADVRNDMADLIDMTSKRGGTITMKQAYDKACMLNPQIQAVLTQRAQHKVLTGNKNSIASKREAASSISGSRVGNGAGVEGSMRETLSSAWDNQGKI